jgi:HD superfamily phosphodiesterase
MPRFTRHEEADMSIDGQTVAGVTVPDTKLARDATELVRESTTDLIYNHSRRVFYFGSLQGPNRGLSFDPELLYIGAMFHDLGLNEQFRSSGRRFEVDGADEASRFLQGHGVPEDSIRRVWTAIALHTTPEIPEFMEPEVALVTAGVEYDVLGIGYHDISDADRAEITALHPRPDFKRSILKAFTEGIAPKPETTFGNVKADVLERFVPGYQRGNFVDIIENSDWPE